jgi:hypothetical protein
MASRLVRVNPVTVNDVLDGHVSLDLECLDRLYLNGYLAELQVGGQVVQFLRHRGFPVPSPACLQQIGDAFRRSVASYADANHIPVVPLKSTDRNIDVMRRYLDSAARQGRSQVAAIGVAQEPQRVFITQAGIGFTALSNGFAVTEDPAAGIFQSAGQAGKPLGLELGGGALLLGDAVYEHDRGHRSFSS